VNADWKTYRVSVDFLEQETGYDLLSNVPVNIQSIIEAQVDTL
jgi:endonuclease G